VPDPTHTLSPAPARLQNLAAVLGDELATWAARDDSTAQPGVRQAANTACSAIDAMLAELHRARQALTGEMRASDDAAIVRADALIAAGRARRRLCAHADLDGDGMHFLEAGETCPRLAQPAAGAR
jgi:hypothetical protein